MTISDPNRNLLWARAIVEELSRSGLRDVVVSPGSRSAPLALAFAQSRDIRLHVQIDERSAGFFALGIAKASNRPAALVCTSGSAGAHYYPAVIEAWHARVPLLVLTADRPPELMNAGAGQTMNQRHLFSAHVREFIPLGLPELSTLALCHLRTSVCKSYGLAAGLLNKGPAGPVHLNVPFQTPLEPTLVPEDQRHELDPMALNGRHSDGVPQPFVRITGRASTQHRLNLRGQPLLERVAASTRGLIVCGPTEAGFDAAAVHRLAAATGMPLLADPLSSLRTFERSADALVCVSYDLTLRCSEWADALSPDLVIRFGQTPTSKPYKLWRERFQRDDVFEIVVDPEGDLRDPSQLAQSLVCAEVGPACDALIAAHLEGQATDPRWVSRWDIAEQICADVCRTATCPSVFWEGGIATDVISAMPASGVLFAASSMPVRDVDGFGGLSQCATVLANRGVNGIDGLIATAAGVAANRGSQTVLLVGDVAFLHDAGSLLTSLRATKPDGEALDLTIVVINNGGGAIFSYLPIAAHPEHFESLFLTPPGVSPAAVASGYGVPVEVVDSVDGFRDALDVAIRAGGVRCLEARVDRETNVKHHQFVWQTVAERLLAGGGHG